MKKKYIRADTVEMKIQLSHLITTSDPDVIVDPQGSVDAGSVESRRNNVWDDDDY